MKDSGANDRILKTLLAGDAAARADIIRHALNGESNDNTPSARTEQILAGEAALDFSELAAILREFQKNELDVRPEGLPGASPLNQKAFYDAIRAGKESASVLTRQLKAVPELRATAKNRVADDQFGALTCIFPKAEQNYLGEWRARCKRVTGFLTKNFNIFADKNPAARADREIGEAVRNIAAFDKYCREKGVTFDETSQQLTPGEKPKTLWDWTKELRFAIAAVGGVALGLGGMNLITGQGISMPGYQEYGAPVMAQMPGLFFSKGLPWLGGMFISLNIFKAFTEYSVKKEMGTLGRFAAVTGLGFGISYLTTVLMTGVLPPVDPEMIKGAVGNDSGPASFSPMAYIPYIAAFMTGCAVAYKSTKSKIMARFNESATAANLNESEMAAKFNEEARKAGFFPWLVIKAGNAALRGAHFTSAAFPAFINYVGIPAVAALLSHTMYEGGVSQLSQYGNYYATAFTGMAAGTAAMLGLFYAAGCRGKDFGQIFSAYKDGVLISSSSACLPKEKQCLLKMGVTEKTADSVLPLAGVFNMYGTSLYLGLTAFYGLNMFNSDPTLAQYAMTAASAFAIAMGAPGIPASNIALLDPVMQQTGLAQSQIQKIYAMVLPMDRLLDMKQTGMNVMGDMFGAVWKDWRVLKARNEAKKTDKDQRPPASGAAPG